MHSECYGQSQEQAENIKLSFNCFRHFQGLCRVQVPNTDQVQSKARYYYLDILPYPTSS